MKELTKILLTERDKSLNIPIPFTPNDFINLEPNGHFYSEELPTDFQIHRFADRSHLLSKAFQGNTVLALYYDFSLDKLDENHEYCQVIITKEPIPKYKDQIVQFIVENVRKFMVKVAEYMREQYKNPVIGVTGSAGKSMTSKMICRLLNDEQTTATVNMGNHNNRPSVPYYTANMVGNPNYTILELAGDSMVKEKVFGNLAELAQPTVGVVTTIGGAHLSTYKDDLNVAEIKSRMVEGMRSGGALVINHDITQEQMAVFVRKAEQKKIKVLTYSMEDPHADVFLLEKSWDGKFSTVKVHIQGEFVSYRLPGGSEGMIQNSLGALLVLKYLGVELDEKRLKKFEEIETLPRVLMRREFERVNNEHVTIVDDTHNSSVPSMHNAISYFKLLATSDVYKGTKLLILARIGDLGKQSQEIHYQFIQPIAEAQADYVFLFGPDMKELMKTLRKQKILAYYYEDPKELIEEALELLDDQSLVVLKGSTAETEFRHVSFGLPKALINQGGKQIQGG